MDSPPVNSAALKIPEEKYQKWLCLACTAHNLSLVCKDFANEFKCSGVGKVLNQALKISLVIGDSAVIRSALHDWQQKKYGKTKAIAVHCPTRWAITLMIALDLCMQMSRNVQQVFPTWSALEAHIKAWVAQPHVSLSLAKDVVSAFIKRRQKHHNPTFSAAFPLDRTNFEVIEGIVRTPLSRMSVS